MYVFSIEYGSLEKHPCFNGSCDSCVIISFNHDPFCIQASLSRKTIISYVELCKKSLTICIFLVA